MNEDRIIRHIEINAPVAKVWDALTDHRKFGEWFRVKLESPFEVGKTVLGSITWPDYEGVKWEAVIQKIEPMTLFSYMWPHGKNDEENKDERFWTLVEFRLEEIPNGTMLTITESGLNRLPPDRRSESFRGNSGGWTIQVRNIKEFAEGIKEAAANFLKMVAAGKISEAYDTYISPSFIHHNQYFKGDRESLRIAMTEAGRANPNKTIEIRKVIEDNGIVTTLSHVRQKPDDRGGIVVHMFRFQDGKVVELWDVGQPLAEDSPNENGPF
jgi:uncharacterized protein YndB with AHSA1/START domain/predicted SnoaL-like aldol condensation-catalyzing enzyme